LAKWQNFSADFFIHFLDIGILGFVSTVHGEDIEWYWSAKYLNCILDSNQLLSNFRSYVLFSL